MTLGIFTLHSCSDGEEMYKRVWCMCKVVALLIKPVAFLSVLFPLPLSLLKLPFVYPQFWGRVGVVGILTSTLVHGVGILSICHLWIFLGGRITTKLKSITTYSQSDRWQKKKLGCLNNIIFLCHLNEVTQLEFCLAQFILHASQYSLIEKSWS